MGAAVGYSHPLILGNTRLESMGAPLQNMGAAAASCAASYVLDGSSGTLAVQALSSTCQ